MGKRKTYKEDRRRIEKETKEIINNVCSSFSCDAETIYDAERNETYCKECGKCI